MHLIYNNSWIQYLMEQESNTSIKSKFIHAIANDTPITKLWKFRVFIQAYPNHALDLKEKMLQFALKNKLVGEYQAIYALFGVSLTNIPRTGVYDAQKTEMQTAVNKLKIQASQLQQVGKVQEQLKIYLKLGEIYSRHGQHKQSEYYYSRILRKQSTNPIIRDEDYLWHWGREVFYLVDNLEEKNDLSLKGYHDLQFFSVRVFPQKKSINATLAFVRDIYRLTKKGRARNKVKVLQNILEGNYSIQDLLGAKILNLADLGLLYSLLSLAIKDRKSLKKDIKWSSKLEISYLNADYAKLLQDINKAYENYGQFSLPVKLVYEECLLSIKKRIFCEIFNAYQTIPVSKVEEMTGVKAVTVQIWVKQNCDLPYLWDPITQSVIYYQKTVPLYNEALAFYRLIKQKFDQKQALLAMDSKQEMDLQSILLKQGGKRMFQY